MQPYEHLTLAERESLYLLQREGQSIRAIGRELHRSPSSISRELKRNRDRDGRYNPWNALAHYIRRRKKSRRPMRYQEDSTLKTWTMERLALFWPPETIVAIWKKEHPQERLGHTSIYRAIKRGLLPHISERKHLRQRGKRKFTSHNTAPVKVDRRISEWPVQVTERIRVGDWEGDTVRGAPGKGVMLTLVDRASRFLVARLCHNKRADTVRDAIIAAMQAKPVQTMSFDNGSEFTDYHAVERELNTTIYFADPHSPWQRGTNENLNGVLRFFFPKGSNLLTTSQDYLDLVVDLLNDRPRKSLGWLSPREVFFSKCCT